MSWFVLLKVWTHDLTLGLMAVALSWLMPKSTTDCSLDPLLLKSPVTKHHQFITLLNKVPDKIVNYIIWYTVWPKQDSIFSLLLRVRLVMVAVMASCKPFSRLVTCPLLVSALFRAMRNVWRRTSVSVVLEFILPVCREVWNAV